ncbi:Protein of unknown function [Bacillus toyonensis]|nr:Protein of unknown function [Bacillus toyonensis]
MALQLLIIIGGVVCANIANGYKVNIY